MTSKVAISSRPPQPAGESVRAKSSNSDSQFHISLTAPFDFQEHIPTNTMHNGWMLRSSGDNTSWDLEECSVSPVGFAITISKLDKAVTDIKVVYL
ncbi:hypothetical protein JTE90_019957 [Oedothorax gibbosus]|uniref:Uncharacterized protein n=1 Tax=Oedothorax gibbosus TaxID=931172 RepID=A0AAV6UT72_9ARAC|nr:hypothetical protein JTE90_019957 [Oedothorax gibbosus]